LSESTATLPDFTQHTAVLIVDMQNGFCHPEGSFGRAGADVSGTWAAIPGCVELIAAGRAAGLPIVLTRAIHEDDLSDFKMLTEVPMYAPLRNIGSCVEGTWDAEFVEGIAAQEGDLVITKSRFSPFVETDIAERLRALGVERLLVGGVGTSACVESTVRDAAQRDFSTYVVPEATGDISVAAHEAALNTMGHLFGWTVPLAEVKAALSR
jgi:ureidoacrylate peracid hydrolase